MATPEIPLFLFAAGRLIFTPACPACGWSKKPSGRTLSPPAIYSLPMIGPRRAATSLVNHPKTTRIEVGPNDSRPDREELRRVAARSREAALFRRNLSAEVAAVAFGRKSLFREQLGSNRAKFLAEALAKAPPGSSPCKKSFPCLPADLPLGFWQVPKP